jgi:iron uptake system component EfeO
MRPVTTRTAVSLALLAASPLAAACGSDGGSAASGKAEKATAVAAHTVTVKVTDAGCKPDHPSIKAGPVTFRVKNQNATAVSEVELRRGERIMGEKENLSPGFSGSFSLRVDGGSYSLYCPGARSDRAPLHVSGSSGGAGGGDSATLLKKGTRQYAGYVRSQAGLLEKNTDPLLKAIKAGKLSDAQHAYAKARPFYEHIEPVAESFTSGGSNLDMDIDARAGDVPKDKWKGFHVIEQGLFQKKSTDGLTSYANGLQSNVGKLKKLTSHLAYQPAELGNGAVGLLDEVSKTKITGEEERYSHIDVLDIQANVEGAEQAYSGLLPSLRKVDPSLAKRVSDRFAAVDKLLDRYRDAKQPGGFVRYSAVKKADLTKLSHAVTAVAEPLSQVPGKIVNA